MKIEQAKLKALIQASSELVSHLDEPSVIRKIIADASVVVQSAACSLILVDDESGECFFYTATGPNTELLKKIRFRKELGIAGNVLKTRQPVIMGRTFENPDHYKGVDNETGIKTESLICVPIVIKNSAIGVVEAVNKLDGQDFSDDDVQMLLLFANFAAIALKNARAYDKCRNDAEAFRIAATRDDFMPCQSPAIKAINTTISKVARTRSTVLITGESGSGKEIVASSIHRQSERRDNPFICLNCAALESNLLASELFGHEKGAYTGAVSKRLGRFELARHGTIFLDEIVDAEPAVQARLLRVLETRQFERLGSSEPIHTDARVIAATNVDPVEAVSNGKFREDLYHRLNVIHIHVPPLRERKSDIPGLFAHFAEQFAMEIKVDAVQPTSEAMNILKDYYWPGNVRELKNLAERASVLCGSPQLGVAEIEELFPYIKPRPAGDEQPAKSLWDSERRLIEKALVESDWNQSKAARTLGITRHHLRYRIAKFKIQKENKKKE